MEGVQEAPKPNLVAICTPTITKPYPAYSAALEASLPALDAVGIEYGTVFEIGCPYISGARAAMLRKALDAGAQTIVFIDHDMSWRPEDLVALIQTPGDVVAGLYRFKTEPEEYMGAWDTDPDGRPVGQHAEGTETVVLRANCIPAGFMKITRQGVARFMRAYPQLCYGDPIAPHVDLFNHGAHEGVWWGEDYAFSRNWRACGGDLWVLPDLDLDHHTAEAVYPGNLHRFLLRQPGGVEHQAQADAPDAPAAS